MSLLARPRHLALAGVLSAVLSAPAAAAPLFELPSFPPPPWAAQDEEPQQQPILVAQSQEAAQLAVRIQQLEEQIRILTGQVEGLQFQMTQMQTLIQKMQEDNEFRFQELEGGTTPRPQQSGALTPQAPAAQPLPQQLDTTQTASLPATDLPMDNLGESQDPMVGAGDANNAQLGTLPETDVAGRPLDLSPSAAAPANGDAVAQYNAGYDALVRGDYAFAEDQFRQFVALYPNDPQTPDATNWLGEALLQRGAYEEAADVLLTGFQRFPNATRAPDILMKLGVALNGAGERDTACRTFVEIRKRYPDVNAAFRDRLADEEHRAECPPAG